MAAARPAAVARPAKPHARCCRRLSKRASLRRCCNRDVSAGTSMLGVPSARPLAICIRLHSSWHDSQDAKCRASSGAHSPGPALRRSYDPTTARSLSSNQLLQPLDGIVVVDPCRSRCSAERGRDLVVTGVFLNPQQEDLPLKTRQPSDPLPDPLLGFAGRELGFRVGAAGDIAIFDGHDQLGLLLTVDVPQRIGSDGEQPGSKGCPALPALDPAKRSEERLLHQVLHFVLRCTQTVQKSRQRLGMAADQLGSGPLISASIGGDQSRVRYGIGSEGARQGRSTHSVLGRLQGGFVNLDGSSLVRYLRPMRRPSVIAHRGASGYEYENSRAAFRRAVMLDADGVELDVHATRDGGIVVHHDPDIPGLGPISQLSLAEAREIRLRNGELLPVLSEILELVGNRDVWVEVKSLPVAHDEALLTILDRGPTPHRYAIHSFDHRIVHRLGETRPSLKRGILLSAYLQDPVAVMRAVGARCGRSGSKSIRISFGQVHDAGGAVIAWTVNEIGDLDRMVRLGVDGLCGNYPDRIRVAIAPRLDEASRA